MSFCFGIRLQLQNEKNIMINNTKTIHETIIAIRVDAASEVVSRIGIDPTKFQ